MESEARRSRLGAGIEIPTSRQRGGPPELTTRTSDFGSVRSSSEESSRAGRRCRTPPEAEAGPLVRLASLRFVEVRVFQPALLLPPRLRRSSESIEPERLRLRKSEAKAVKKPLLRSLRSLDCRFGAGRPLAVESDPSSLGAIRADFFEAVDLLRPRLAPPP